MFSQKFRSKEVRAAQKSLDATFNNLGNKIKELTLDPNKEKTIIDILDEAYTEKALALIGAASRGEIKAKPVPTGVTVDPEIVADDLAAALGGVPAPELNAMSPMEPAQKPKGSTKKK